MMDHVFVDHGRLHTKACDKRWQEAFAFLEVLCARRVSLSLCVSLTSPFFFPAEDFIDLHFGGRMADEGHSMGLLRCFGTDHGLDRGPPNRRGASKRGSFFGRASGGSLTGSFSQEAQEQRLLDTALFKQVG